MAEQVRVEGLRDLQRLLKQFAPEMRRAFHRDMRGILAPTVADAKARASWSSRIPSAIRAASTQRGAAIKISRKKAPHGPLYERGGRGNPGQVRWPLFGNHDLWFGVPTRPYVDPALRAHTPKIVDDTGRLLERVLRDLGAR